MEDHVARSWLQNRIDVWRTLEQQITQHRSSGQNDLSASDELIRSYQNAQGDLSFAESELPNSDLVASLRALLLDANREISRPVTNFKSDTYRLLAFEIPLIVISLIPKLIYILILFAASILIGWTLVSTFPELASLFLSPEMIDTVQAGTLWTERIFSVTPASVASFSIMTNNIVVSFTAFVLGAFYGLGTFYIVVLNGLLLGSVFSYTRQFGLADELFNFVIAHGCVELSVIILTATAGFALGEAIAHPGLLSRLEQFQKAARKGWLICLFCVPFLIIAGLIEGYISPGSYAFATKLTVGVLFWFVFVIAISGVWLRRGARLRNRWRH
tara:strand:+ start:964 stop:1953 length:990 start_codon:yes stop_codon:yes gene_type:complete